MLNMNGLKAVELAGKMNLSRGRISQMVKDGVLDGCFAGTGRRRRFDLDKCLAAYQGLDPGQRLGNGAKTHKAIEKLEPQPGNVPRGGGAQKLPPDDDDGYLLARTEKAVEEVRKLRRVNAEAEGAYVLASEVEPQTRKLLRQEITEMEMVLRDGARHIADELGVDFKEVRKILIDQWRAHRAHRDATLTRKAEEMALTATEAEADI